MARTAISKKTRFEVFKRDSFTCQYCGAHPPTAILHVDHMHPVAAGGTNDINNLVTACQDCNLGKGANLLTDVPQSLQDKAIQVIEREEQLRGYQEVLEARRRRIAAEAIEVCDVYEEFNDGYTLSDQSMVTVRHFVEKLGVFVVREAMERAFSRARRGSGGEFRYFCGICWNKIREAEGK